MSRHITYLAIANSVKAEEVILISYQFDFKGKEKDKTKEVMKSPSK